MTITEIPLNKLVPFQGNVRKSYSKRSIAELAESIRAHGLLQNLNVIKEGKNFAVVAGERRQKALQLLVKDGHYKPTHPVPCKIEDSDFDPREISLAENVMREDMHTADQFEAFRNLVDKGIPAVDIAARFGKSLDHVNRLLKLARVSRAVLKAYRADTLTLQQVMAFAVSDDHEAQDHVLEHLRPHSRDPQTIREALTENEIPATDKRVKFVTLKAYEEAGGAVRYDLFSEGDDSIFILDVALLDRLVTEKLGKVAKSVAGKEGWKWTETHADFGYQEKARFQSVRPDLAPLPAKLAKEVEKLKAEAEKLETQWEKAGEDAPYPDRIEEIRERLENINDSRDDQWSPEKLAMAGTVVTIGDNGKAEILRGFVRPEDMPKKNGKAKPASTDNGASTEEAQSPALSSALVESLTAQKSAALAAELSERPDIALAAVVHALASCVLLDVHTDQRALQIGASSQSLHRVEGSKAFERMEAARQKWRGQLPADADALWMWCLEQKQKVLLDLLAFCAAATVDAVQGKADKTESDRLRHALALASALKLDMKEWFAPDAPNYFSRVSKPQIFEALQEVRTQPPAPAWEKLKKAELAQLAERELCGKGWLPEVLRTAA